MQINKFVRQVQFILFYFYDLTFLFCKVSVLNRIMFSLAATKQQSFIRQSFALILSSFSFHIGSEESNTLADSRGHITMKKKKLVPFWLYSMLHLPLPTTSLQSTSILVGKERYLLHSIEHEEWNSSQSFIFLGGEKNFSNMHSQKIKSKGIIFKYNKLVW